MTTQRRPGKGNLYDEQGSKRGVTGEGIEKDTGHDDSTGRKRSEIGREWDEAGDELKREPTVHVDIDEEGNVIDDDDED